MSEDPNDPARSPTEFGWPTNWPAPSPFEPTDADMHLVSRDEQMELMRRWFLARYCDPASQIPWNADMNGCSWVRGEGSDPRTRLRERFGAFADDGAIDALAAQLYLKAGARWASIVEPEEDFAEIFAFDFERPVDPPVEIGRAAARTPERL